MAATVGAANDESVFWFYLECVVLALVLFFFPGLNELADVIPSKRRGPGRSAG